MKKKKIVVMRSYIVSLSCLYLMICSSCGNPRSGESKNEDNTKEIEIVKKEPITYNFYVENSGSVKGFFKGNTNDASYLYIAIDKSLYLFIPLVKILVISDFALSKFPNLLSKQ